MREQREPARLVCTGGSTSGQAIPLLGSTTVLGRAATCQVVIEDDFASRRHAQITLRDDGYWLRDLDSKNGTLLDGQPLAGEVLLEDGAVIQIGDTRLRFHDPAATMTHPAVKAAESPLAVDEATRQTWLRGQPLSPPLSTKQFDLLCYLWGRAGQAVSKDEIAAAVWPEAAGAVYDYQVDKMVSRLRDRLRVEGGEAEEIIETVWGYGYRLKEP
jgi:predicted component of type VI protein secretion system